MQVLILAECFKFLFCYFFKHISAFIFKEWACAIDVDFFSVLTYKKEGIFVGTIWVRLLYAAWCLVYFALQNLIVCDADFITIDAVLDIYELLQDVRRNFMKLANCNFILAKVGIHIDCFVVLVTWFDFFVHVL